MFDLRRVLRDRALVEQLLEQLEGPASEEVLAVAQVAADPLKSAVESISHGQACDLTAEQEAIILAHGRPVLYVQDDSFDPSNVLPVWRDALSLARARLERVIPSVGRIELRGHPRFSWVGTGWLIAPRVVVTNRHVAEVFGHRTDAGCAFRADPVGKRMRARLDMYQEHQRASESEFQVKDILHIEPPDGHDVALLRVAPLDDDDRELPAPIVLADHDPVADLKVGAIGYAAWDGSRNERDVMDRIFDGVYDVKRVHPGEIVEVEPRFATHDCSTLGGNSGSAMIDLATGEAVALHFAGRYEQRNYAVKASTLRAILDDAGVDIARGA